MGSNLIIARAAIELLPLARAGLDDIFGFSSDNATISEDKLHNKMVVLSAHKSAGQSIVVGYIFG